MASSKFDPGEVVEVRVIQSGQSTPYQPATVVSFDALSQRYEVALQRTGETASVKAHHTRPLPLPAVFEHSQTPIEDFDIDDDVKQSESRSLIDNNNRPALARSMTTPHINTKSHSRSLSDSDRSSIEMDPTKMSKVKKVKFYKSKSLGYMSPSVRSGGSRHQFPLLHRRTSVFNQMVSEIYLTPRRPLAPNEYDVDDAMDKMGMGKIQWFMFGILGLISFAYAMEVMVVAFLLPILQSEFGVTPLETTFIPMASIIGSFLGATVLGKLSDQFGRRIPILIGVSCTAIAGLVSALCDNIIEESIARFFVGFFMKIGVVAVTLFAEFLPTNYRGKVLILQSTFWTLGMMASVGLAWVCLTYYDWRMYVKLSTIPLWIAATGAFFMKESPHYLIASGRIEETKKLLEKISEWNGVELPEGTLVQQASNDDNSNSSNSMNEMNDAEWYFTSVLLLLVYIIYQSGYYGVIFVSVRYFAKLDSIYQLHHEMYWEMILTSFSEIPGIVVGYFLIDYGRKRTMNISFALFTLFTYSLMIVDVEFNRGIGIFLLFCARLWIAVAGMGAGVYFLEYFKTKRRATMLGIAVSMSMLTKMGAIICAEALHIMIGMYVFGTLGNLAFIASLMLPNDSPETWFLED